MRERVGDTAGKKNNNIICARVGDAICARNTCRVESARLFRSSRDVAAAVVLSLNRLHHPVLPPSRSLRPRADAGFLCCCYYYYFLRRDYPPIVVYQYDFRLAKYFKCFFFLNVSKYFHLNVL